MPWWMIQPLNKNQKIPTKNIENTYFVKLI
jgi:hypothetical protein